MLNRALSATWNMWVANWEQKTRAALLWGSDTLRLKTYQLLEGSAAWSHVAGPRELYIIESGVQPVGMNVCGDTCVRGLHNFCRRKAQRSFYHPPPANSVQQHGHDPLDARVPNGYDRISVDAFREQWNQLALRREHLLMQQRVNWEEVKHTLHDSNQLLSHYPEKTLHIARLAMLPLDWVIDKPDGLIDVMCGLYPASVGQIGCITCFGSLFAPYREHLHAARALANHFLGLRHRRLKSMMSFGKLPRLGRMMAKHGCALVTILGLEKVHDHQHGGQPEHGGPEFLHPNLTVSCLLEVEIVYDGLPCCTGDRWMLRPGPCLHSYKIPPIRIAVGTLVMTFCPRPQLVLRMFDRDFLIASLCMCEESLLGNLNSGSDAVM